MNTTDNDACSRTLDNQTEPKPTDGHDSTVDHRTKIDETEIGKSDETSRFTKKQMITETGPLKTDEKVMDVSESIAYTISESEVPTTSFESQRKAVGDVSDDAGLDSTTPEEDTTDLRHQVPDSVAITSAPAKQLKRKNYCPYCGRLLTNYSRHLVSQHPDEEDVRAYVALSDVSPKRRKVLRTAVTNRIRNRGNKMFNMEIVEGRRRDSFIPARRPSNRVRAVNNFTHVTCKHCLGFFKKELLFKHLLNCTERNKSGDDERADAMSDTSPPRKKVRPVLSEHAEQLVKEHKNASKILKEEVFSKMQKDELTVVIRSDSLICKFGTEFRNTHRRLKQVSYCSSRLRSLARIYLKMKIARPDCINEFSDCIVPKHFDLLVRTVRQLSNYDAESGTAKTPSVTPRLCSSLKRCANIMKSEAIKSESLTKEEITEVVYQMNNFLHLMEKDWSAQVGTISEISRRRQKVVKKDLLPDPDDIRTFSQYIHDLCPRYITNLEAVPTVKNYERLAKLAIAHIITLNRRRPNETVEITTEEYRLTLDKRTDYGEDSQSVVTAEEMESGKDLVIFYVAANKNLKKVPVLLTKVFHRAVDVLLESQEKIGVRSKYIFARPGKTELFDGSAVLREIVGKADLKSPNAFTANALRHHAATSSQLQSRDDTYTKRLSKFMGHNLQTHEYYYEMPLPLVQKNKVGHKLLQMIRPKKAKSPMTTCTVTSATTTSETNTTSVVDTEEVTNFSNASTSSQCSVLPPSLEIDDRPPRPPTDHSSILIDGFVLSSTVNEDPRPLVEAEAVGELSSPQRLLRRNSTKRRRCGARLGIERDSVSKTDTKVQSPNTRVAGSSFLNPESCETTPPRAQRRCRSNVGNDGGRSLAPATCESMATSEDDALSSVFSETPPKKVLRRRRWTSAEKTVVYETFGQQFLMNMKPARSEIKSMWQRETTLKDRTLEQVVTYVNNIVNEKHHIPTPTRRKIKHMVACGKTHLSP